MWTSVCLSLSLTAACCVYLIYPPHAVSLLHKTKNFSVAGNSVCKFCPNKRPYSASFRFGFYFEDHTARPFDNQLQALRPMAPEHPTPARPLRPLAPVGSMPPHTTPLHHACATPVLRVLTSSTPHQCRSPPPVCLHMTAQRHALVFRRTRPTLMSTYKK